MKKLLPLILTLSIITVSAQVQKSKPLKKVMELKMPKTADDDNPGTRGASVAWHPLLKKYYAAFAGNVEYPLAVFDDKGKRLSAEDQTTLMDVRGLWYNPVTRIITGNGHADNGWFSYQLDKSGIPSDIDYVVEGMNQPDAQSVGSYDALNKQVLFLYQSRVYKYDSKGGLSDSILIHWGRKKADGPADDEDETDVPEDYNYTSLINTGVKGQEIGFLNITNKQIELYDIKTGYLTKTLSLPETAITEQSFNFAYANGIFWLFNMELRKWVGYK